MITIEIDEEVENMQEMENLLEEVLSRVRNNIWRSYEPSYAIMGNEEEEKTRE